jgi:acyl-CoA reductase-like NAD-dependent aldehyde dehydrogenase
MPYDEIDEAIEIANGTPYGLGASVFGPDQRDCIAVAKRLDCGMVSVNDFGVFYVSASDNHFLLFSLTTLSS